MGPIAALICLIVASAYFSAVDTRQQNQPSRPVVISLVVDNSSRIQPTRPLVRAQLSNFVRTLRPDDHVEIVEFSNDINIRQRFTTNADDATKALTKPASPSGRALYGAIHTGLKELEKFRSLGRCGDCRFTLVAVASGPDISSVIEPNQLISIVRRTRDITIFGVVVPLKGYPLDRQTVVMLRKMAEITGGRVFLPQRVDDLPEVYSRLRNDLIGATGPEGDRSNRATDVLEPDSRSIYLGIRD